MLGIKYLHKTSNLSMRNISRFRFHFLLNKQISNVINTNTDTNTNTNNFILGNATTKDTLRFVQDSNIPLYHKYEKCNLYINPIIHGPPNSNYYQHTNDVNTNDLVDLVIHRNRSNCIYVYSHLHDDKFYSINSNKMYSIFNPIPTNNNNTNTNNNNNNNPINRRMIVTVGDIGFIPNLEEIRGIYPEININKSNYEQLEEYYILCSCIQLLQRVEQARTDTKLDVIDMVTLKVTEDVFFNIDMFDTCISLLNSLCMTNNTNTSSTPIFNQLKSKLNSKNANATANTVTTDLLDTFDALCTRLHGKIQFYGLNFYNIQPYCCYTPPKTM